MTAVLDAAELFKQIQSPWKTEAVHYAETSEEACATS